MVSFTTQICDRCKAHFPLKPNDFGERPVRKVKIEIHHGMPTEKELCSACRDVLSTWFYQTFMERK